jgi:hypothetical protein
MTTHILDNGKQLFDSHTHANQTALSRAMQDAGYTGENSNPLNSFRFDLIGSIKDITTKRLKDDVLNRLTFSIDAYISGALSKMLADFYRHSKGVEGTAPTYATYGDFLHFIEGLTASEDSLHETGCEVTPSIERIRNLVALRNEIHAVVASQLNDPMTYVQPDIREYLATPRLRSLSAAAERGLMDICEDDTDDIELQKELLAQYKLDDQLERMNQLRLDTMKSKSLVVLFSCIKAGDGFDVNDEDDAFFSTDARTQYGLINTVQRAVADSRRKAVTDNRLPVMEKATLRVEAKALLAKLTTALDHPIFADVQ